jgi:hypothetical protein
MKNTAQSYRIMEIILRRYTSMHRLTHLAYLGQRNYQAKVQHYRASQAAMFS